MKSTAPFVFLPPKALEVQKRLQEEQVQRAARKAASEGKVVDMGVLEEVRRMEEREKEKGLLEKVWMGGESEDWKAKRDERERKALEEGKGYGDLIMDQIWDVWNWGQTKTEEIKKIDENIIEEKKGEGKR